MADRPGIEAVLVVVPAHDEEDRIGRCLTSVAAAAAELRRRQPELVVTVTVALDRCTDGTAAAVAGLDVAALGVAGLVVDCLAVDVGCVGAARRAGIDRAALRVARMDPDRALVVNTDADCVVPVDWLVEQVALAADHDVVLGEVEPEPTEMTAAALALWWRHHPVGRGSLHGANLGCRLGAYRRAGGFLPVSGQEDLLLVRSLRAGGAAVVGGTRVTTSGRRESRVPGGFAGYLRDLDRELLGLRPAAT